MIKKIYFFLLVLLAPITMAQGTSPFSQSTGLGTFLPSNFQANFAKAGIGASSFEGSEINPLNPASYAHLKYTTGEASIYASINQLQTNAGSDVLPHANLGAFGLGFPLGNNWGAAFGLQPLTSLAYDATFVDASLDDVNYAFEGEGGLNQVFLGFGKAYKQFTFGVNGYYYFGRLNNISKVTYFNEGFENTRIQNVSNASGFGVNLGAQYKTELSAKRYLTFGGLYSLSTGVSTSDYTLINYFTIGEATNSNNKVIENAEFHDFEFVEDTRGMPTDGEINLPSLLQGGVSWGEIDKWELSLEYQRQGLDEIKVNGSAKDVEASNMVILGGNYVPNINALGRGNYWKNINYSFGIKGGNSGLLYNNEQFNDFGINFGIGLPLKKFKYQTETFGSSIHFGFGYLNRSINSLGISEEYYNLNFSIILNDKWFIKRKFQ